MQHSDVSEGNFIIKKCFIFKMIVFYGIFWSQKPLMFICKYNLKKSLVKPILFISHTNCGHSWINKLYYLTQ